MLLLYACRTYISHTYLDNSDVSRYDVTRDSQLPHSPHSFPAPCPTDNTIIAPEQPVLTFPYKLFTLAKLPPTHTSSTHYLLFFSTPYPSSSHTCHTTMYLGSSMRLPCVFLAISHLHTSLFLTAPPHIPLVYLFPAFTHLHARTPSILHSQLSFS
jgi:hypothetical protein